MDLWKKGTHTRLIGYTKSKGEAKERLIGRWEDDKEGLVWIFHSTLFSVNLCQAGRRLTVCVGVKLILMDESCTNTGRLVTDALWEKNPYTRFSLARDPHFYAFEEYNEVL